MVKGIYKFVKEMGMNLVAIIPNEKKRTQGELTTKFGCLDTEEGCIPFWKIFEWEGRSYASWCIRPRYVEPKRNQPRWVAVRLRLVEVMEYLGAREVYYGNDVVHATTPENAPPDTGFLMPLSLKKELLKPPDEDISVTPGSLIW